MSWKRGTLLQFKSRIQKANADCVCLGPNIQLFDGSVTWTPVRFYGEDCPDWQMTRMLEKRPKIKPPKPI